MKESVCSTDSNICTVENMFKNFERMTRSTLIALVSKPNLRVSPWAAREDLKKVIMSHVSSGKSTQTKAAGTSGCSTVIEECKNFSNELDLNADDTSLTILELALKNLAYCPLKRILQLSIQKKVEFTA